MSRIYKRTDRIKIKIDDVVITISPLSYHQKVDVQSDIVAGQSKGDFAKLNQGIIKSIKYSLKDISGLEDADGQPYKLQFENDEVTDECISELFNIELHNKLVLICSTLTRAIPSEFTDSQGRKLEGVEILSNGKEKQEVPNP